MKKIVFTLILIVLVGFGFAQTGKEKVTGKVSYLTAQNIYVRFDGTNNVQEGDTIFINQDEQIKPLLIVESKSSISCMGKPFPGIEVSVGEEVFAQAVAVQKSTPKEVSIAEAEKRRENETEKKEKTENPFKEKIKGRVSASSYSAFSNETTNDYNRMRYSFSLKADHISDSRFSADAYINYNHRLEKENGGEDKLFDALKIYSLVVRYQPGDRSSLWVGRKINPNLSNIGAIDGVQFETGFKNFSVGAALGFRPDYGDYGFNANLLEYGAYFAHEYHSKTGSVRSSLAFFEQQNNGNIDRRFLYFQHSNNLLNDLFFFVSSEIDLYKLENGVYSGSASLTSLYLSLRYRILKQLSVYASYDARKNVIYFETFKNLADRLLEEATRQGVHFRVNYRPVKLVNVGANVSYRNRDGDARPSKTFRGFVSVNQIPGLNSSVTFSANMLQTSYLDGKIFGATFYKDLWDGKLYSSVGYRYVDYDFVNSSTMKQHIAELDLTWRISKKWSVSGSYEGSFENSSLYNTVYLNLVKRF
ncbi:hypothetical protein ACUNWD_00645 [Sunxiuqinia sp. A32]|uniref:hypothetical protein n=1 Tax=Sunxiuqinia sp. A32 TaxID=3461496 RepID=UPI004045346E